RYNKHLATGKMIDRIKLCFDTQHYFVAEAGRTTENYKKVLDKYGKDIQLCYINNMVRARKIKDKNGRIYEIKETIFESGHDIHEHLLMGLLPQEIFKTMVQQCKGAAILETPRKKDWDKQEQLKEVQTLRYYAMDILSLDRELEKELLDRIRKLNEWDPRKDIQYSDLPMEVVNNYQENPIDPMDYLMNSMKNLSLERKERYQNQQEDEARKNIHNNKIEQITQ